MSRTVDHYNLDAILAVGYRVRSHRGTQFRVWATERLREYLIKGLMIHLRHDATQPNMGLTTWDGERPRKADVSIAKNYFQQDEIEALNRIVTAYLEFAELQALNRKPMSMVDWIAKLDDFLKLSDRDILTHAGKISHEAAKKKAEAEFARFQVQQATFPQSVDAHFEQSLDELKKIESQAKEAHKKASGKQAPKKKASKKSKGKKRNDD